MQGLLVCSSDNNTCRNINTIIPNIALQTKKRNFAQTDERNDDESSSAKVKMISKINLKIYHGCDTVFYF
jgi:hypothetical protein